MTIQQMADQLNLSRATVSAVLNNLNSKQRVSQATRMRVLEYAKKHNFHQNISALAMKGKYSKTLAVVAIDSYRYPVHGLLIGAIESYTSGKNISSAMFSVNSRNPAGLSEVVQQIKIYNVKKIIILATAFNQQPEKVKPFLDSLKQSLPETKCYVYDYDVRKAAPGNITNSVYADRNKRYGMLNEIAISNNYRKIVVFGAARFIPRNFSKLELEFRHTTLDFVKHEFLVAGDYLINHGIELAKSMKDYDFKAKKTLVYIQDDFIAMGFTRQMNEYGYSFPPEFGLVSWGNLPPTACMKITSLGYDYNELSRDIVSWIDNDDVKIKHTKLKIIQNNAHSF